MRANETKRAYHERRLSELKSARSPWEDHWRELAEFIAPSRLRLSLTENQGRPSRKRIIDSTASLALRTLASGMHSGITSPARPWFRLTTFDQDLKEFGPVKTYLSAVESRMREVFAASNIYNSFHQGYGDLGLFGQSCGLLVEDADRTVRMMQLLHGAFWIGRDHRNVADTCYREFRWSVERVVARFGLANVSQRVKDDYDRSRYDNLVTVCHAVEPRRERDPSKLDKRNKAWTSNYWEEGARPAGDPDGLLEESGFDTNPIIAPPWELVAEDHYALSPSMDALPDVKMLQVDQRHMGEAIEKMVRPAMVGPVSMRNNPKSLMPGSLTYVDEVAAGKGFRAAYEVNLRLGELDQKNRDTRQRVDRALYADLFLMLANMEGVQPRNQFEIAERKEEKLLALGPVLENIYGGQLAPLIDRTFQIMNDRRMLPPPPREIADQELKVEYTSILAQAQKAVSTGSIERLFGLVGNVAGINPTALDKVDFDQGIDVYADLIGTPPSLIVSDDDVAKLRSARQQEQAQAKNMEAMAQMAPAAKQGAEAARLLADTDTGGGGSILQQLGLA